MNGFLFIKRFEKLPLGGRVAGYPVIYIGAILVCQTVCILFTKLNENMVTHSILSALCGKKIRKQIYIFVILCNFQIH